MASRFWAGSSSESEQGSDHSVDSEDEKQNEVQVKNAAASRWAIDSDSDSEEEVRVVRSAKDKAFIILERSIAVLKNHMKINDWAKILSEFDGMMKHLEKAKSIIATQGYPKYYLRYLVSLEEFVNVTVKDKPSQKKMGKEAKQSFIRMKTKIKRHAEDLASPLAAFRANPEDSDASDADSSDADSNDAESSDDSDNNNSSDSEEDDDDQSGSSSDEEDDEARDGVLVTKPITTKVEEGVVAAESDSDDWPSGSEQSLSDDDSESEEENDQLKGRLKWLKTATVVTSKKKERGPRVAKVKSLKPTAARVMDDLASSSLFELLTHAQFDTKLKEIIAARGKRATENSDQLAQLRRLVFLSKPLGAARQIMATMNAIGAQLYDSSRIDRVLAPLVWQNIAKDITSVVKLLNANPAFRLVPYSSEDFAEISTEEGSASAALDLPEDGAAGSIKVSGDVASFVDRLSEEYVKSLQQMDPHTSDYISRLYDEGQLITLAASVQAITIRFSDMSGAAIMAQLQTEFSYYKHATLAQGIHVASVKRKLLGDADDFHPASLVTSTTTPSFSTDNVSHSHPASWTGPATCEVLKVDVDAIMAELTSFVYTHGDDRLKTRAMLCGIYHHCLHDRFTTARDLLLMSHLQETIGHTDIPTQILFNRMMAQVGLAAFRSGRIKESHGCLSEICQSNRVKELLAQGVQSARFVERDSEAEKLERRRQTPYHMHINLELLEYCHLTCAMLLEVPNMASQMKTHGVSSQHHSRHQNGLYIISKNFRRYFDQYDRQVFSGPPENTRDHVIAASKCLFTGEWRTSRDLLLPLSVWDLFPGSQVASDVRAMLGHQLQLQALRTYLLTFGDVYHSLSLSHLHDMFELDTADIHACVSAMMTRDDLRASWESVDTVDPLTKVLVMHPRHQTRLQQVALAYSEKCTQLVEHNERLLEHHKASAAATGEGSTMSSSFRRGGNNTSRH